MNIITHTIRMVSVQEQLNGYRFKSKYFSPKIKDPKYGTNFLFQFYLSLMFYINLLLIYQYIQLQVNKKPTGTGFLTSDI